MESMPVNWEALDSLIIDFIKAERLVEDSSSSPTPSSPSSSSSASSVSSALSSSASSSSSYRSRLLIRQIRRRIEAGDVDAAFNLLRAHAPGILDDHRILFRLQKQKFIELLRTGTERDRDSAIQCLRQALAPCALDAYPEAYDEFKHILLALIYDKDDESSPVANEWSERRRFDLSGLLSSILRAYLQAYDPILSMALRYLISIHKVFCLRQGISSPISDLTERLLFEDRDAPAIPQESLFVAPPFDEVDIQALAHAVELTRQGAVDSLKFAKGDLFQAFQNELCRTRLDVSALDELVREYCIYRGIIAGPSSSSDLSMPQLTNGLRERTSQLSDADGEASVNNGRPIRFHESNTRDNESGIHCSSEITISHEDCSTSDANHFPSISRRLRRSRYDVSKERVRKRWRGRANDIPDKNKQHTILFSSNETEDNCGVDNVSRKCFSVDGAGMDEHKYEILLEMKELASKGMAAEVVEEVNAVDPEFFTQNPFFLFQLKQIEFFQLVNGGHISLALKVASTHLGPLAASNQDLLKSLKETLLVLLKPNEHAFLKGVPLTVLATSLQVALGRRFGIEEPQFMRIMRATLHTHNEWFKMQMCKDRFEVFLKIDRLKEFDVPSDGDSKPAPPAENSSHGSSKHATTLSGKLNEDDRCTSQTSSSENLYDENAIIKVMEFLALPRSDAIHLLMQYNGNAETVIQQMFS